MKKHLVFNFNYFILAALLFITEVFIGVYVHDSLVRPFGGDFLVVILIYCSVKSFVKLPVGKTARMVLLFAYAVEISQYFKLVVHLGLKDSKLANILLGHSFSWIDMLMYTLGIWLVIITENTIRTSIKPAQVNHQ